MADEVSHGGGEAKEPSFDDLLAPEDSPASDPQSDETEASAAPAEQEQSEDAVERQDSGEQSDREPFIPRERFDEVNTKYKEAREWRERYGWAEGLQPEAVNTMREWFGRAAADPRAFALQLVDELAQNPEHAAYLRSEFARRLGGRAKAGDAPPDEVAEPEPDIDVTDKDGNVVGKAFTDKQLAKRDEWRERQFLSKFESQYGDRFKALDEIRQRQEAAALQAQADQFASSFAAELSKLPLFEQHKAELGQYMQAHPPASDEPGEIKANALMAYWQIVGPKLNGSGKSEVLADLQRKAKANTGVNPGSSSSAAPPDITDFDDPRLEWS